MEILTDQTEEETQPKTTGGPDTPPPTRAQVIEFYTKANEILQLREINSRLEYEIVANQIRKVNAIQQLASMMAPEKETPDQSDSSENTDTRDNPKQPSGE